MVIILYLLTIFAMVNLETIISNQSLLLISNTFVLFPQILENAWNWTKEGLNLLLAVGIFGSQSFVFFFIYLFELNFEKLEKGWFWFSAYVLVFIFSITILYLQKKNGARFFIPKRWRNYGLYDYSKIPETLTDQICSICICEMEKDQKLMHTQCGHTYHKDCLEQVIEKRLECPMCWSTLIPPADC